MNPVKALEKHGQAVWLDFLARGFIAKGELKTLIDRDGVRGVTSNPSIFEKAIGSSDEYDAPISKLLAERDRSVVDLYELWLSRTFRTLRTFCVQFTTHFRPRWLCQSEVSPYLARYRRHAQ